MENLDILEYWIQERYSIYKKKEAGVPPPYTKDPILNQYRFCNVHRENDAVTKWIRTHMPTSTNSHPEATMTLARLLNRPQSIAMCLGCMGENWDFSSMTRVLKAYRDEGLRIFNAAYIVSTCGKKMDKIDYVLGVVKDVYNENFFGAQTCEQFSQQLQQVDGIGTFLAGQIVADLKNTARHRLCMAEDKETFVVPGPGSLRGLGWLHGSKVTPATFSRVFWNVCDHIDREPEGVPFIDAQDFQNCLCEFDKYMRTKKGGSKPKQRYQHERI